jgi:CRISPR/Cas system-associated exonuclease Cas4 (RecB family)
VDVASEEAQLRLFDHPSHARAGLGLELPPLAEIPRPPRHDVRRLSYSALALHDRCSYRYFAERVLGLPPVSPGTSGGDEGVAGMAGTELGDAVHRLLEDVPLEHPEAPSRDELAATVREWYPSASDAEIERISGLVDAYCGSELARRVAGLVGARPERPFAFEQDGVLLHGRLDVLWQEGPKALVVDYKSNVLDDASPEDVVEEDYRVQRLVYALACLRAGAEEVEVVYQFLERPEDVVSRTYTTADEDELARTLSTKIERIRQGEFMPSPSEFVCADCPALDLLCAGPKLTAR